MDTQHHTRSDLERLAPDIPGSLGLLLRALAAIERTAETGTATEHRLMMSVALVRARRVAREYSHHGGAA